MEKGNRRSHFLLEYKKKETISTFYFHCVIRVALVAQEILDHWRTCVQPFVHHCLSFCLCFVSHCIVSLLLRFTASDYYFNAFSYVSKLITNFRLALPTNKLFLIWNNLKYFINEIKTWNGFYWCYLETLQFDFFCNIILLIIL